VNVIVLDTNVTDRLPGLQLDGIHQSSSSATSSWLNF